MEGQELKGWLLHKDVFVDNKCTTTRHNITTADSLLIQAFISPLRCSSHSEILHPAIHVDPS